MNMILILVGPSGCGKTTQENILAEKYNFKRLISYTTREIRDSEINHIDYHFITKNEFEEKVKNNFFFETTHHFGNSYGAAWEDINNLKDNENLVTCLCPKGFKAIKNKFGNKVIGIYLMPPDKEESLERLKKRETSTEDIENRITTMLEKTKEESSIFKHIVQSAPLEMVTQNILKILGY